MEVTGPRLHVAGVRTLIPVGLLALPFVALRRSFPAAYLLAAVALTSLGVIVLPMLNNLLPSRLMTLGFQVFDPIDHSSIFYGYKLMTIRVRNIKCVRLVIHCESGAHGEVQTAPIFDEFSTLWIPNRDARIVAMMV